MSNKEQETEYEKLSYGHIRECLTSCPVTDVSVTDNNKQVSISLKIDKQYIEMELENIEKHFQDKKQFKEEMSLIGQLQQAKKDAGQQRIDYNPQFDKEGNIINE